MEYVTAPVLEGTEAGLIARVATGDPGAIEQFYSAHADPVFQFIYRRIGEQYEDSQELSQETFLAALKLAATYDGTSAPLTWLFSIAKLRIATYYRRVGRLKRIPRAKITSLDDETTRAVHDYRNGQRSPEEAVERMDTKLLVDSILKDLNDNEREALLMRYAEELSLIEIAQLLGKTEKAVEGLLTRAKKKAQAAAAWLQREGKK